MDRVARRRWQASASVAVCAGLGWYAFGLGRRVPLLSLADLGFHELGHLVMYVFPISELLTAMMGSVFQVVVPVGLGAYFLLLRREPWSGAVCLAWGATSLRDVSVYVADAPYERLELIGGEHDWAFALGPDGLDRIDQAAGIATAIRGAGLVLVLLAVALAAWELLTVTGRAPVAGAGSGLRERPGALPERSAAGGAWPRV